MSFSTYLAALRGYGKYTRSFGKSRSAQKNEQQRLAKAK